MKAFVKSNRILSLILAISIICTAILIGVRIGVENDNKNVSMIMKYRDVYKYALAADIDIEEALERFASVGVAGIIVENFWYHFPENEIENVRAAGMEPMLKTVRDLTVEEYAALMEKYDIKYPLIFTYRYFIGDTEKYLNDNDITLALVEDKMQTGHEYIRGFDVNKNNVKMVRVFELVKYFASRYGVLGYEGAEEIENVLYRAVTDRNIRVLWIMPFYDNETDEIITDIEEYREVFENLAERMKPHGQTLGRDFSSTSEYKPSPILVLGALFGICAFSVLLLGTLFRLSPKLRLIFTLSLCGLSFVAYLAMRELTLRIMAFVIVSVMPCIAVYFLLQCAKMLVEKKPKLGMVLIHSTVVLLLAVSILMVGGSFVGAILGESRYMLEFEMFRGVKLSQTIPLVYTVILIIKELVYKKGKSLRAHATELAQSASRSRMLIALLGLIAIICAVVLFIVRTGNTILQAGELEQRFRIFFEVSCVARPRTKELLIAWPALMVSMLLFAQNRKILGSVALFAASIGCASVCNTFCHIRAYYLLSVIRTAYGVAFGLAIGIIGVLVVHLILRATDPTKKSQKSQKKC